MNRTVLLRTNCLHFSLLDWSFSNLILMLLIFIITIKFEIIRVLSNLDIYYWWKYNTEVIQNLNIFSTPFTSIILYLYFLVNMNKKKYFYRSRLLGNLSYIHLLLPSCLSIIDKKSPLAYEAIEALCKYVRKCKY